MNSEIIQVLVLAAIALFLVLRLRSVLGTRSGFEKPDGAPTAGPARPVPGKSATYDVLEGGDADIAAHAEPGSVAADALRAMKAVEPGFNVSEFIGGARQAYEMIVTGFEQGDISGISRLLSPEVLGGFEDAIAQRKAAGLSVEANFVGVRSARLVAAAFDTRTSQAELTLELVGELFVVVRNDAGEVVEGDPNQPRQQTDLFTFERTLGQSDPNWVLVATGE
ncbi:Tim44 domain-containing protein [Paroceanicella profunda]|uniref:Tim44 domain-containing protein n=1 Tax=Paroceanicella profunda TaxID=2579971 RepID=A0A5B8FGU7_9RHOB|nr:Tim44/TimA family putative adaptor protein [Paroceanicella profunda]QDL91298.1 Tim44 domain-containing protein [Paroceanicella profunda]